MSDLVLFHYPMSPFSEKIRAMLGYANLSWFSVKVSEMPPRPELNVLAGGYRKIPVAQLGADIFCDTRTIAAEIARLADTPELILDQQPDDVQAFVETVDLDIFMACVIAASDGRLLRKLIRETSLIHAFRFLKDRISMGKQSRIKAVRGAEAKDKVIAHIADLERRLDQDFLFGTQPCIADFSAYHGLWFVCELAGKPWLRDYPKVASWMSRMKAFGHGTSRDLSSDEAIERARTSEPRELPTGADNDLLGSTVSVAPTDYGRDPVTGTLVHAGAHEAILAREVPEAGRLHVHFPKQGFFIKPA
ncbi:glutathione S-transferase family protein [Marinobacter sp. F4206]|uniref:glutathione S-transferase family protein n=1 Tax=Marinobacter sp. F4206 TaxID=2861777 RepID=UPI001C606376|nr:glutathione S-transferase family protein [Marinobacter sp. F4206]MBW4934009.1 glutathione S-transferase C-terminal domain-containing protein [Marinobacter sp. F4206]